MKVHLTFLEMSAYNNIFGCCMDCGLKRYPNMDRKKMIAITVSSGTCPICGRRDTIIPISDFEYASGDDSKWD